MTFQIPRPGGAAWAGRAPPPAQSAGHSQGSSDTNLKQDHVQTYCISGKVQQREVFLVTGVVMIERVLFTLDYLILIFQ